MALVMIVFVFWAISLGHFGGAAAAGATIWLILILAIKFALLDLVYLPYKLKRLYFAHIMTNGTGFSLQKEDKKRLGAAKCDSSYLSRSFFARKAGLRLGAFLGLVGSALVLFIFGDAGNAVTCLVIGAIVWFFALSGSKGDKLDKRMGKLDETLSA